ncbi:MAG: RpiB/LacA/LacB family sugar-phosphate isomerase [Parcubacteria group bacterium]|nr:RpiB/LacA/LacB family sugar-phosphate isomerase [Parcubacteria group bacterium]
MLYLASDHRGFKLKEHLKGFISARGIAFEDVGNHELDSQDDYPDFAFALAQKVAQDSRHNSGLMICGSGLGMVVAANKVKGVRAGLAVTPWLAKHGRENDDLNVLSLAADITDEKTAEEIVKTWLNARFDPQEKYVRRLGKIEEYEKSAS